MSLAKETRRRVQESGSPLRKHSLNQQKLKSGNEGQRRYEARNPLTIEEHFEEIDPKEAILQVLREADLPLSPNFLDEILPFMIDTAIQRAEDEKRRHFLTIPQRAANTLTDVGRIYKAAKSKNMQLEILKELPDKNLVHFSRRMEKPKHTYFPLHIFMNIFHNALKRKIKKSQSNNKLVSTLVLNFSANLASTDFALEGKDFIVDRVETYAYLLNNIANIAYNADETEYSKFIDLIFPYTIDACRKQLVKR